jgi:signal transduction histidine kinase
VALEVVLRNLLGNAVKHHHQPEGGHVWVSAQEKGDWIEFAVTDDGPGIDPQFHERIFGVFQTLKPRDEVDGSGIGLALVKRLVEMRGGTIVVESSAGHGATFRFTWPKFISSQISNL